jgi:Flp pilus assembly protein TadD
MRLVLFVFIMLLAAISGVPVFAEDTTTGEARELLDQARKLGNEGNIKGALEEFKKATLVKPDYAEAHRGVGLAYIMLKRNDEAITPLKEAIKLKPDYVDPHYNLGVVYGALQRHDEAIAIYKETVRLKPDYAEAHFNLALSYGAKNKGFLAIKHMKKAKALYKAKGDIENVSKAGKDLRIFYNKYEGKLASPTEVTSASPKMDLKEKIRLAKKRQNEINDQFKTLEEMEGLDDSLISSAEKLEAVKNFIRDYPDRNPKLREAQEMLKRIED